MAQTKTKKLPKAAPKSTATAKTPPAPKKLVDMMDEILDAIDTALEDSCVAHTYRQKGGE